MSIASQLVQKMGGDKIHLESALNKGSRFYFTLPLEICQPEVSIAEAFKRLRVGIFAQDHANLHQLTDYLTHFKIQYELNAEQVCTDECSKNDCVFDVCLVLSNQKLLEVQEMLDKKTYYVFFEPPLECFKEALENRENVVYLGDFFDNNSRLYNLLLDYIVNVAGQKLTSSSELFNQRILLVEDNTVNQILMTKLFEHLKLTADLASNGVEAIEMYQAADYGLVLMDINMPIMGGIEALQVLQRMTENSQKPLVPVVALTANVLPEQVAEYQTLGFYSHLAKPIEIHKLTELLTRLNS